MKFDRCSPSLLCALLLGLGSLLQAEETFEHHVQKLADDSYAVRAESIEALVKMCRSNPELVDRLAPVILDDEGHPERIFNAREVVLQSSEEVLESHFPQPKSIGIKLTKNLMVRSVTVGDPGERSGISHSMYLVSVGGKSVKGKTPADIDAMIQATKIGTRLEMGFKYPHGDELLFYPAVGGEVTEFRRKKVYEKWLARMRQELKKN